MKGKREKIEVYDYFRDIWRRGFYTLSTSKGYITVPSLSDVKIWFRENRDNLDVRIKGKRKLRKVGL